MALTLGRSGELSPALELRRAGRPNLSERRRLWLLVGTCASSFLSLLIGLALGPFLPEIASDLGVSVALLGQVPAVTSAGAAVLGLLIGPLADHYGLRRALVVGLVAGAVLAIGTSVATSVLVMVIAGVFGAVARAVVSPVATALSGVHFEGNWLRRAVSIQISATSGAAVLGVPLLTRKPPASGLVSDLSTGCDERLSDILAGGFPANDVGPPYSAPTGNSPVSGSSGAICCAPTISGVVEHAVDLARAADLAQAVVGEPDDAELAFGP